MEIGDEKNINHNAVAEKGVQELEEEILKVNPENKELSEIDLAKATETLNRKIRHTSKSAKELFTRRKQGTGEEIEVNDKEISEKQHERRKRDNEYKMTGSKEKYNKVYKQGDLVFVVSDKNKVFNRSPYLVLESSDTRVTIVKAKKKAMGIKYTVKKENIYKPPVKQANDTISSEDSSSEEDDISKEDTSSNKDKTN